MFDTTNMASFAETHKSVDSRVSREATRCVWLVWASQQMQITPHMQGVLVRMATLMDAAGAITLTQKEIAAAIRMSERQTRAAIADLVKAGVIERKRRGGVGAGRVCDVLSAILATGAIPPLATQPAGEATCDNGDMPPEATGEKAQPATGDNPPVSQQASVDSGGRPPVDSVSRARIEHAGARAEANLKNTTSSENNLQTPESEFTLHGGEAEPRPKRASRLKPTWRPSDRGIRYAAMHGIKGEWLERTLANFVEYWSNRGDKGGLKLDWALTWEREIDKEAEACRHHPANNGRPPEHRQQRSNGGYRSNGIRPMVATG